MASFGAKYIRFNQIVDEPDGQLPVYKDGGTVTLGRLVKADLTVNLASGKLYAEDELAESVDEFSSGSLAVETDDMEDTAATEVYGCTVTDGEVHFKRGDSPPMGGLAYYKVLMRKGVKFFKGFFYPRVKAALGNDTAQTKGDSITFGTTSTTFTIFGSSSDDWRIWKTFKTENEARAWVDQKLKGKKKAAAPTATPAAGAVASGATVALATTTPDAVIRYTTDGSDPTETSPAYSSPIEITEETTIKAVATAEGFAASDVLEAHYTLTE